MSDKSQPVTPLNPVRLTVPEVLSLLKVSRAHLYGRIREGAIRPHKDGGRTFFTMRELERYVASCDSQAA